MNIALICFGNAALLCSRNSSYWEFSPVFYLFVVLGLGFVTLGGHPSDANESKKLLYCLKLETIIPIFDLHINYHLPYKIIIQKYIHLFRRRIYQRLSEMRKDQGVELFVIHRHTVTTGHRRIGCI